MVTMGYTVIRWVGRWLEMGTLKVKKRKQKKSTKCYKVSGFKKYMIKLKICHLSGYFFAW